MQADDDKNWNGNGVFEKTGGDEVIGSLYRRL